MQYNCRSPTGKREGLFFSEALVCFLVSLFFLSRARRNRFAQGWIFLFSEGKSAKKQRRINQVARDRILKKWNGRHITGRETLKRPRIQAAGSPDAEICERKKQHRTGQGRASDGQQPAPRLQLQAEANNQGETSINPDRSE